MASSTHSEPHANKKPSPSINIDLDVLVEAEPFLLNLTDFLREKDDAKALRFWLEEYENTETAKTKEDVKLAIDRSISEIDHMINDQLNTIIHHPRFQKLEASWRGLWYLAVQADGIKNLKVKVLDVSWSEVTRDINRAMEFDQSQLFRKIYNEEYGIAGGEPYGAIIGDYQICHKPTRENPYDDITTLKGLAEIAAAAFSPFIASASYAMFGVENFQALGTPLDLKSVFETEEYIKWRALRDSSDSRFIGLTVPRILMRRPYRTKPGTYKGLFFYEKPAPEGQDSFLWGSASYAFGAVLIREFGSVGWFGHIRGVPRNQIGGGLITNLPVDAFETDSDDIAYKPSTDVVITDSFERELGNLGFVPLCQCYDTPFAAFYSNQSVQKPRGQTNNANINSVNAKLSSMLQHVLCASRVAHYIKVMIRDKVGSFISADSCESMLRNWLFKYTSGRDDLAWEEQARYPLRQSEVIVKERADNPGKYYCTIRLVPHYQVDQMVSEMELVTELLQTK